MAGGTQSFPSAPSQPLFNHLLSPPPLHKIKLNLITRELKLKLGKEKEEEIERSIGRVAETASYL